MTPQILAVFAAALAAAAAATPLVRAVARRHGLVVAPSADRWHTRPTALYGGVAIAAGAAAGVAALAALLPHPLAPHRAALAIVAVAALLALVGIVDDARGMSPVTKFLFQLAAACGLLAAGLAYPLTPWLPVNMVVSLFWFVGITNAMNLLDNMDGITAGVSAVAAAGFALLFLGAGDPVLAGVALAVAGGAAGFLIFNFKPASIFMGDAGSLLLGSALAGLGMAFPRASGTTGPVALVVPTLVLLLPVVDTTLVTATRTLHGRRVTLGGRDHVTHRLVAMGLSEARAALFLYAFGAAALAVAWVATWAPAVVGLWLACVALAGALLFAAWLGTLYRYEDRPPGDVARRAEIARNLLLERRGLEVLLDVVIFGVASYGAMILYYDSRLPPHLVPVVAFGLGPAIGLKLLAFYIASVYRGVWHRAALADGQRVVAACVLAELVLISVAFLVTRGGHIPRTVFVLDLFMTAGLALTARVSFRLLDRFRERIVHHGGVGVLVYGAGDGADPLLIALQALGGGLRPVGFLDGDPALRGRSVRGLPVLQPGPRLAESMAGLGAEMVVCGRGAQPGPELLEVLGRARVRVSRLELSLVHLAGAPAAASADAPQPASGAAARPNDVPRAPSAPPIAVPAVFRAPEAAAVPGRPAAGHPFAPGPVAPAARGEPC